MNDQASIQQVATRHVYTLWGPLWPIPSLPLLYGAVMFSIGDLRLEHVLVALLCAGLAYATPKTQRFLKDVAPYLIVAYGYDMVRYARQVILTPERVLGCDLRNFELSLFAIAPGVTFQDWFAAHHTRALDLLFAIPYTVFAYVAFIYAAYLYFADRPRMRHYLWSFAIANYTSFAMWLIVPAAPPWYLRAHGCQIDLSVAPNPAGLLRVDAYFGMQYFQNFYGRAASVFGALPSMHCAYPLLGLLTAWHAANWRTRPLHLLYVVLMFGASVYLDHHWIVDGIAGWAVAICSVTIAGKLVALQRPGPADAAEKAALLRSEAR